MGQQLLILMTLLAGGDPHRQMEAPTDELKCVVFECTAILVRSMAQSKPGRALFQDQNQRNIVDQLAYLLAESLAEATSDAVQIAASEALLDLNASIDNRVLLASLLPRIVSSLTKALKPNTQARRTRQVLIVDLKLLGAVLTKVLADRVVMDKTQDHDTLDEAWLKATTAQVKNALAQVCKLRTYSHLDVRNALFDFCLTLMEEFSTTLKDSSSILIETVIVLSGDSQNPLALSHLKSLLATSSEYVESLRLKFHDWSQALPRVMQGSDDRPKDLMIMKLRNSFDVLSELQLPNDDLTNTLGSTLLKSVANAVEIERHKSIQTYVPDSEQYTSLLRHNARPNTTFEQILFNHQSQQESAQGLTGLIRDLSQRPGTNGVTRAIVDSISDFDDVEKVAPVWLSLQLLKVDPSRDLEWNNMLDLSSLHDDRRTSRVYLVQDLYVYCKDILMESSSHASSRETDARLLALVLESVSLQAQQLGHSYRSELYETLYPVLAMLSSRDAMLQRHAVTTLNSLAASCEYTSVSALLVENVDYLVNSIAWKLNTFNLSPEAPAVLNMLIRLVGATVIPYLDDLIASIFVALDSFHGYSEWVEMLFQVLKAMVDESVKDPQLSITDGREGPQHRKSEAQTCTVDTIIDGLHARRRRKVKPTDSTSTSDREVAPRRPWTKAQDDPGYIADPTHGKDIETLLREAEIADQNNELPAPENPKDEKDEEDLAKPLSKSHDLLLKIARSTIPHLSNPSSRVRQILLQLLKQVSPLLARHENTFLPFVNDVWPAIVQRVFADVLKSTATTIEAETQGETAFNVALAAEVVAGLCVGAGDFMSTRIEQIFSQLKVVYESKWKEVEVYARSRSKDVKTVVVGDTGGRNIRGAVDLQVVKKDLFAPSPVPVTTTTSSSMPLSVPTSMTPTTLSRTGTGQIFSALVRLLAAVLNHVRLTPDHADEVFDMLAPLIFLNLPDTGGEGDDRSGSLVQFVQQALERYNSDIVWVLRCRRAIEDETARGLRAADDGVWGDDDNERVTKSVDRRSQQKQSNNDDDDDGPVLLRPIIF